METAISLQLDSWSWIVAIAAGLPMLTAKAGGWNILARSMIWRFTPKEVLNCKGRRRLRKIWLFDVDALWVWWIINTRNNASLIRFECIARPMIKLHT